MLIDSHCVMLRAGSDDRRGGLVLSTRDMAFRSRTRRSSGSRASSDDGMGGLRVIYTRFGRQISHRKQQMCHFASWLPDALFPMKEWEASCCKHAIWRPCQAHRRAFREIKVDGKRGASSTVLPRTLIHDSYLGAPQPILNNEEMHT